MSKESSLNIRGRLFFPTTNRQVYRGHETAVEPRIMRILVTLNSRRGSVVSKSELMKSGWPEVVVTDDSLAKAISELRKLFGDESEKIVETIRGKGYRLNSTSPWQIYRPRVSTVIMVAIIAALSYLLFISGLVHWAINLAAHVKLSSS